MTEAQKEAAIIELTSGLATVREGLANHRVETVEGSKALRETCAKHDASLTDTGKKLAELSVKIAHIEKELDDFKRKSEELRTTRWAMIIAILSAVLSPIASAIIVSLMKRT
jgi:phage shock protein A